jgi:L,D-transpeptidase ErfK/SrfK
MLILGLVRCDSSPGLSHFPTPASSTPDTVARSYYTVKKDVDIRSYFEFWDSLLTELAAEHPYPLDEYVLVHANPWLIDTLAHTDYYYQMASGHFVEDPQAMLALQQGQQLLIPDSSQAAELRQWLQQMKLELNIPAFRLRLLNGDSVLDEFRVRVGQNRQRYLAMAGREVDLRTQPGEGYIVRINRNPIFINPKDNHRYETTLRDDGRRTKLPRVPWIEPELDGQRYGQLIHPTTNPATLGKAYSNGCIGVSEGDMWRIYYHAPVGTPVHFYYALQEVTPAGDTLRWRDIYPAFAPHRQGQAAVSPPLLVSGLQLCDCR